MDLSAIIVIAVLSALFFGFIGWIAIYSRRNNREKLLIDRPEVDFSEIRKKNERVLKN